MSFTNLKSFEVNPTLQLLPDGNIGINAYHMSEQCLIFQEGHCRARDMILEIQPGEKLFDIPLFKDKVLFMLIQQLFYHYPRADFFKRVSVALKLAKILGRLPIAIKYLLEKRPGNPSSVINCIDSSFHHSPRASQASTSDNFPESSSQEEIIASLTDHTNKRFDAACRVHSNGVGWKTAGICYDDTPVMFNDPNILTCSYIKFSDVVHRFDTKLYHTIGGLHRAGFNINSYVNDYHNHHLFDNKLYTETREEITEKQLAMKDQIVDFVVMSGMNYQTKNKIAHYVKKHDILAENVSVDHRSVMYHQTRAFVKHLSQLIVFKSKLFKDKSYVPQNIIERKSTQLQYQRLCNLYLKYLDFDSWNKKAVRTAHKVVSQFNTIHHGVEDIGGLHVKPYDVALYYNLISLFIAIVDKFIIADRGFRRLSRIARRYVWRPDSVLTMRTMLINLHEDDDEAMVIAVKQASPQEVKNMYASMLHC